MEIMVGLDKNPETVRNMVQTLVKVDRLTKVGTTKGAGMNEQNKHLNWPNNKHNR
ncbi:MAG: hypothetical protein NC311_01350 [Muribaculaceae bacterium]|nr:hypothetical protein [Muribaculaceae bacterium]